MSSSEVDETSPLYSHLTKFLSTRTSPKTFCPSEVARALSKAELESLGHGEWRDAMPDIRGLVWALRQEGQCEVLQRGEALGQEVRLEDVRGPIRVRRVEQAGSEV
ncbi:hypothetical protein K431DRAFT_285341 [Polychaeton citri CBS 116435]|uniref:Uncharacterized protein n=1 Tax=Polychaeton citri CBS 116435 TaxID=1314669 RepID=A0A9P4UQC2_9PEZI|nr:hypothetical protein K431DRAFT_285341 [Polychaeton citri CBS 116435]